jgi:peptidyl-dipeptidase A
MRRASPLLFLVAALAVGCRPAAGPAGPDIPWAVCANVEPRAEMSMRAQAFLCEFVAERAALDKAVNLAYWRATNASSAEEAEHEYAVKAELELQWRRLHADPERFAQIKTFRESPYLTDPILKRQIELVYLAFLPNQVPDELLQRMTHLTTEVEETFNTFRSTFEGAEATDNDLRQILIDETDSTRRLAAWEALKQVGPVVEGKVRELAKTRNEAAVALGYDNYYDMMMAAQEMDPAAVKTLFDEVADQTEAVFVEEKGKLDQTLAARYGITVAELRPWHYADPFFQEAPQATEVDFDRFFALSDPAGRDGSNLVDLATRFYAGAGMDVTGILAASDLYEKPAKEQHAYCTDIDRAGDVRILANLRSNEYWAETILHELGHGVYFWYVDQTDLPYLLREMHTLSTEAIAELMGGLVKNENWLQQMLGVDAAEAQAVGEASRLQARLQKMIFARWSLVMLNFERELYRDPDQDLNTLWWDLVERYQKLTRPEGRTAPDWASKIHLATAPVYYHNYLMGEMMAAQLVETIARDVYGGVPLREVTFVDKPEAGRFLIEHVFQPGHTIRWDELIEQATGEALSPRAFVDSLR